MGTGSRPPIQQTLSSRPVEFFLALALLGLSFLLRDEPLHRRHASGFSLAAQPVGFHAFSRLARHHAVDCRPAGGFCVVFFLRGVSWLRAHNARKGVRRVEEGALAACPFGFRVRRRR